MECVDLISFSNCKNNPRNQLFNYQRWKKFIKFLVKLITYARILILSLSYKDLNVFIIERLFTKEIINFQFLYKITFIIALI